MAKLILCKGFHNPFLLLCFYLSYLVHHLILHFPSLFDADSIVLHIPQLKGFAQDTHVRQVFLRHFRAGFNPLPGNQIDVKYRYNLLRNLYLHLLTVLFL